MRSDAIAPALGVDPIKARDVRVLVMTGYGLNCEAETVAGFSMLGARVVERHVADLLDGGPAALEGFAIVVFIGGFSFGDHIAGGRVFANRLRYRLGDRLARFLDDGGLALGICNGFQTMVKLGLLPGLGREPGRIADPLASLVHNDRLGYRDAWVRLRVDSKSPCVWTRDLGDRTLEFPSRHGEGKLVLRAGPVVEAIRFGRLIPVRYVDERGEPTEDWPDNPSGSAGGAAGLCDPTGRLFGLMPHPEAYLYPEAHPQWLRARDEGRLPAFGVGLELLAGGVRAAIES